MGKGEKRLSRQQHFLLFCISLGRGGKGDSLDHRQVTDDFKAQEEKKEDGLLSHPCPAFGRPPLQKEVEERSRRPTIFGCVPAVFPHSPPSCMIVALEEGEEEDPEEEECLELEKRHCQLG